MMAVRPRHPDKLYLESTTSDGVIKYCWLLKSTKGEEQLHVSTPFIYTSHDSAIHNGVVLFGCELAKGLIDVADPDICEMLMEECRQHPELTKG